MLFSKNNARNYVWHQDDISLWSVTSTFKYDNDGFADTVNMDWYDEIAKQEFGMFSRYSSSTCDNFSPPFQQCLLK